jgi:hypothetical protein
MPSTLGITLTGIQTAQFDPDALAYINSAAITSVTERYAINNLVKDLKLNSLWSKFKAIYPMAGGSASSHSYNLRNVAQYNLTFNGGWTHNSSGAIPNGTNAFAQTGLNASSVLSATSNHLSFYSVTDSKAPAGIGKVDIGCQIGPTTAYFVSISDYALFVVYMYSNAAGFRIQIPEGTSASGFMLATVQNASSLKAFSNRHNSSAEGFVEIAAITTLQGSLPNNEIYLCRNGNTGTQYDFSDRGCGFASIGDGLSDSEAQIFGGIVQRYVNTISRNVTNIPTVQDINAQAFLTAAGITNSTQGQAIQNLTSGLKQNLLWNKFNAIYPFVGSTATAHKWNLKDPSDLDAAFRLSFAGGWTHSSTGATPNGTNGIANTFLSPFTTLSQNNVHISYYSRTNNSLPAAVEIGSLGASSIQLSIQVRSGTDKLNVVIHDALGNESTNTNAQGFFIGSRISSTQSKGYKNGTLLGTSSTTSGTPPNFAVGIGGRNNSGVADLFTNREVAFASIGSGFSDSEASNLYTVVQAYQTALSRNV